ncbi:hypothetical protein [Streptomyces cyanogenus]|uniref:Uncharacterized protein n=1 Tax=Streptomyces cyanogenus TaxID=80860 RepID=A0ABX7TLU1_STRCY|nr:hypothetical protein [Streptomyces cyanogenus]QTD95864.1 hypothetical protein S1361_00835 [Streptomyces cyanogenus]
MTVKADISLRVPASMSLEDVLDVLFHAGSGLVRNETTPAVDSELNLEFDTLLNVGSVVVGAVQAALSLTQLVERVRQRRARDESDTAPVEVNITVDGTRYNIADLTSEQIRRLLEP